MTPFTKTPLMLAGLILSLSGAAVAQSTHTGGGANPAEIKQQSPAQVTTPGTAQTGFTEPGGSANSGPGSVATEVRGGGTGAASRANNSGAAGNAERPEVPLGNTGGGGGSGSN